MVDSFEEIFTLDVAKTARTDCFLDVFPNEKSEISTKDMLSFKRLLDQEAAKDFISASKQHAEDFSATEVEKNRSFSPAWYSELMFAAQTLDAFCMVDRGQLASDFSAAPIDFSSTTKLRVGVPSTLDWHSELMMAVQTLDAFSMADRGQLTRED